MSDQPTPSGPAPSPPDATAGETETPQASVAADAPSEPIASPGPSSVPQTEARSDDSAETAPDQASHELPAPSAELLAAAEREPRLEAALAEVERLKIALAEAPKGKKKKKNDGLGTSRGIETMFRTSYRTHVDLSGLADNKANIMISINGLIISILIASISPGIETNVWLVWPTTVLLLGCVSAMVFAVLAARPRVSGSEVKLEDIKANRANILFFGNFVTMEESDYVDGMKDLIMDTDRLYTNMIRDIYSLGGVLARKFRLLRYSYNLFMIALLVGVPLFIGVFIGVAYFGIAIPLDPGPP